MRSYSRAMPRVFRSALICAAASLVAGLIVPCSQALAQCVTPVAAGQTCTNPAGTTISSAGTALLDTATLNLTNFGTISGGTDGVAAFVDANVTNYGAITGGTNAIEAVLGNANVVNYGTITGTGYGILADTGVANVINYGTISATSATGVAAISGFTAFNVTNFGTIYGPIGVFAQPGSASSTLTNAGTIIGFNGIAVDFSNSNTDTLTLLPGSRIVGDITLGAGDTVNIHTGRDIGWLLTFNSCGCGLGLIDPGTILNVTGGAPYVVNGNQIAVLDPTAFGLADRTLMDFTGNVSSLLGSRFNEFVPAAPTSATPTAFASTGATKDPFKTVLGSDASLASAYAGDTGIPNATVVDRASGFAVWSKGFVGGRLQDASGPMLAATTTAYGGVMGFDKAMNSGVWLGAFVGAGNSNLDVDVNSQTVKTDYVFGGLYGRFDWSSQFLDFAVTTGHSTNKSSRTVANNLAPGGLETATGSYDGSFVSPELAYGYRVPIAENLVLKPIARLRYVAGFFDGYSETGSAQNLTVSSQTAQNVEERLELALAHTASTAPGEVKSTAKIGVLGQERVGDTTINTVLIGQNLAFATPGQNNVGGLYTGFGIDFRIASRVSLFAAAEGTVMSDKSKTGVAQGGLRANF